MSLVFRVIRRLLARGGYELIRRAPTANPEFETFVRQRWPRPVDLALGSVALLDGDPDVSRIFSLWFDAGQTWTASGAAVCREAFDNRPPAEIVLVDGAEWARIMAAGMGRLLHTGTVVIVRTKPGVVPRRGQDVFDWDRHLQGTGHRLHEVAAGRADSAVAAATGNFFLIFECWSANDGARERDATARKIRVSDATNMLCRPIGGPLENPQWTGRGSHGFRAGVYNPGALGLSQGFQLLARGERIPWSEQKRNRAAFLDSCRPVGITVGADDTILRVAELEISRPGHETDARYEDFRLFRHEGGTYANHSIVTAESGEGEDRPIRPENLKVGVGISEWVAERKVLNFLGRPKLEGRSLGRMEKNWAMFSEGGAVHLIYSFSPFRLHTADAFPSLEFQARLEVPLALPVANDGLPFRNSINPVAYDERHLLHVVHKVYPHKRYVFWAVLIDRASCRPTRFAPRPLVRAGFGHSIAYVSAAVVQEKEIVLLGGLDDAAIGRCRIARSDLDSEWEEIGAHDAAEVT